MLATSVHDSFNFDQMTSRAATASEKWDGRLSQFGRAEVMPLWVADMDFAVPPAVSDALLARAQHPIYGYTLADDSVYDSLIAWLYRQHGWHVEREWVVLAPSVVSSIYAAVQALTLPAQGVIVQPPVYPPFFSAVAIHQRALLENPLVLENGLYRMDLAQLETQAQQGAKLLLLCSPHNPVGRVWLRDELEAVLAIARRYHIVVFSDEIHADLIYPQSKHIPLATLTDAGDAVITAVAPSKTFNLAGLGLSALIIPNTHVRQQVVDVFSQLHIQALNPFSLTAWTAAYQHGGTWRDALMIYVVDTCNAVMAYCAQYLPAIRPIKPEGTYLMWLDCRALAMSDVALQAFFIHKCSLGLNTGVSFGQGGSGYMRINLASPRAQVMAALAQVKLALSS